MENAVILGLIFVELTMYKGVNIFLFCQLMICGVPQKHKVKCRKNTK